MSVTREDNIYMFSFKIAFIAKNKDDAKRELQKILNSRRPINHYTADDIYMNGIDMSSSWELIEARNIISGNEVTK